MVKSLSDILRNKAIIGTAGTIFTLTSLTGCPVIIDRVLKGPQTNVVIDDRRAPVNQGGPQIRTLKTPEGVYIGETVQGVPYGTGKFLLPNGDRFEGQYRDGMLVGNAIYFSADGSSLEGPWIPKKDGSASIKFGRFNYTSTDGEKRKIWYNDMDAYSSEEEFNKSKK